MPKKGSSEAVKAIVIVVLSLIVIFALVSLFKGKEGVVGKAFYNPTDNPAEVVVWVFENPQTGNHFFQNGVWNIIPTISLRCPDANVCGSGIYPSSLHGPGSSSACEGEYCSGLGGGINNFRFCATPSTITSVVMREWRDCDSDDSFEDCPSLPQLTDNTDYACFAAPPTLGEDPPDDATYTWISCESATEFLRTDDKVHLCLQRPGRVWEWTMCQPATYGRAVSQQSGAGDFACLSSFIDGETTEADVWVQCTSENIGLKTDNGQYICIQSDDSDGASWTSCSPDSDNTVIGNFICQNNQWRSCDDDPNTICRNNQPETCSPSTIYSIENDELDRNFFCANNQQWLECNSERQGQGTDNAINARFIDNQAVCNGNEWRPIPQCAPCRGEDLPGLCVGSSRALVSDRSSSTPYTNNPTQSIGCVPESGDETGYCYYQPRDFPYGGKSPVNNNLICGKNRITLTCGGGIPLASDDGSWLCQNNAWTECTAARTGEPRGNFICSFDATQNEWIWFSEFSCVPSQLYQTRTDGQFICDGSEWRSYAEFEAEKRMVGREPGPAPWFTSLISDPANVEVRCEDNRCSTRELNCDDSRDNDRDGLFDTEDTDCLDPVKVILHPNNLYQYNLRKGQLFSISIHTGEDEPAVYERLNVCDTGTSAIQNRLTLCQDTTVERTLESTALLRQTFADPYVDSNSLAFLFEQETTPKTASIMLHFNLASPRTLPLTTFAPNLIAGQRMLFSLDGEHYLLAHEARPAEGTESAAGSMEGSAAESFAVSNLQITHIETGEEFPASLYPGTNVYVFHVLGSRVISAVLDTGSNVARITALAPGEAPESFPTLIPQSWFEASFAAASLIRITTPNLGILSICRQDNPADRFTALICRNNNLVFTLQENTYSRRTVQNREYLFRYSFDATEGKKVSVFQLYSCASAEFAYNAFINQLLSGEDIACQLNNRLYFIKHPLLPQFSVLSLGAGDETGFTALPSEGSTPTSATFSVTGASITVDRSVDTPQAPFRVTARAVEELTAGEDVLLPEEFYATLTTANSVRVGTVSLRQCNQELFQFTTAANVCLSTGEDIAVTRGELFTIGGQRLLLEVNGATGNAKEVFIRKLLTFTNSRLAVDDWSAFTQRIRNNDVPVIELPDGRLFRPEAGSQQLQDFSLEPFPSGISLTLRNREELTPITSRGAFVAGNTIIAAQQEAYGPATARKIRTIFTVQLQPYLPEDRSPLRTEQLATQFSVQPGGVVYTISAEGRAGGLVQLRLDGESLLFRTSLAAGDARRLFLENVRVEIKVVSLGETAVLEIRRL